MVRLRLIRRLLARFSQLDGGRRLLLAEAMASLFAARLALIFVAFPRLARHLGSLVSPTDPRVSEIATSAGSDQAHIAKEVSWAVTRVARYVPFKAVCLPQAMAARGMLRRRGITSVMHLGVAKGQVKLLDAHAWLEAAGVEVTGYPLAERLAEIACFV
jgi:transglutaminase superfamily protein